MFESQPTKVQRFFWLGWTSPTNPGPVSSSNHGCSVSPTPAIRPDQIPTVLTGPARSSPGRPEPCIQKNIRPLVQNRGPCAKLDSASKSLSSRLLGRIDGWQCSRDSETMPNKSNSTDSKIQTTHSDRLEVDFVQNSILPILK